MIFKIQSNKSEIILISGPSSSGKSELAEYFMQNKDKVAYIATCDYVTNDMDWVEKINRHRNRRPKSWISYESLESIISTIDSIDSNYSILIDSIGGFVSRYIQLDSKSWEDTENLFIETIRKKNTNFSIVIEETGWSVVPPTKIGNIFRERLGKMAQKLELISDQSWLVIQGRAIDLKKNSLLIPRQSNA